MDRSKLKLEDELGSGQFGVVYKGFAEGFGKEKDESVLVAVKGLRSKSQASLCHRSHKDCNIPNYTFTILWVLKPKVCNERNFGIEEIQ